MLVYQDESLVPIGYTDSDFQSDLESRKSISGYVGKVEESGKNTAQRTMGKVQLV